jgi:hypothetical protein
MPDAIEFTLDDGTTVAVAATRRDGSSPVGARDRLVTAQKTLREALAPVTAAAAQVMDEFRNLAQRPDEVEIEFGVTLDSGIGGIIASASAGAHLDVTLRWHSSAEPPPHQLPLSLCRTVFGGRTESGPS